MDALSRSKNKILFSIFIFCVAVLCFIQAKSFFMSAKTENQSLVPFQTFQSPCRGLVTLEKQNQKKILFSKRVDRLDRLMRTPIDWVFKNIKGEVIDLYCYREKKQVLIHLWATWCASCVEELSALANLATKKESLLLVVAITTESIEKVQSFIQNSFSDLSEHLQIVSLSSKELHQYFVEDSLPVTYVFSKNGRLNRKILGPRLWLDWQ